jgi:calcium-dependent protein kinase
MGCIPCQRIQKKNEYHIQKTTGRIIHLKSEDIQSQNSNLDDYITIRLLGTGKSSEVLLSLYRPANEYRALKIIKKSFMSSCCSTEFMILQKLDHPNVLKCFEMLEDSSSYYISSLYCEGGNLSKKLKSIKYFNENDLAKIMHQVLSALAYFHENCIIHRDLKLENILLENSEGFSLRIADFGLAYFVNTNMPDEVCGTPLYMAPEVGSGPYDEKVDLWSAGVVLFVLATGHFPYRCRKAGNHSRPDYSTLKISAEKFTGRSKELLELVSKFLELDPKKRISANEALENPWIKFYSEI